MTPARARRADAAATRLLLVDPARGVVSDGRIGDLRRILRPGDLLVVNDAATLPASLHGTTSRGEAIEVRLAGPPAAGLFRAVLFGRGDFRTRTEDRPQPPVVVPGERLAFGGLAAMVAEVDRHSPRLVGLTFDALDDALWQALYREGRPVQYAHTDAPLALWDVQTPYASRPWAAEAPSAGFALAWGLLSGLRARGVEVARLTHAAGLSSTGDPALDARLPFPEAYEVPADTVAAVERARASGGRIVAVGTSVTRALESAAERGRGELAAGGGVTDLLLGPGTTRRVVDGVLTGIHEVGASHFRLLEAFAPRPLLEAARRFADESGYEDHEFGDALAVIPALGRARPVDGSDARSYLFPAWLR